VTKALRREGVTVGRDQVGRLMAALGIQGLVRGKAKRTTKADPSAVRAPDLVKRDFSATEPNRLWVMDFERHEALLNPAVMKGHRLQAVAAA